MLEYSIRPKTATMPGWEKYSYGSLGISMSNENATGDRLLSIIKWMQSKFDHVIIDFSDTLFRWNLRDANGNLAINAYQQARKSGDRWVEKNKAIFEITQTEDGRRKTPPVLIRWEDWFVHPDYNAQLIAFNSLYCTSEKFQNAVETDIRHFSQRAKERGEIINDNTRLSSLNYILEEVAVHTLLARKLSGQLVQLYPGSDLKASSVIRRGLVKNAPSGLQKVPFVALRVGESRKLVHELFRADSQNSRLTASGPE